VSISWLSFLLVGGLVVVAEAYLASLKRPSDEAPPDDGDAAPNINSSEPQPST
jgi:hypothetical protein